MSKLIVCMGTLLTGGAERVLSSLSFAFADAYDEVEYLLWLPSSEISYPIDPRVKITSVIEESGSEKRWKQAWWFRQKVKRERPTMILSFMLMINYTVLLSLFGLRCNVVVSERNDPRRFRRGQRFRNRIYWLYGRNNVKGIVMQTENNRGLLPEYLHHKATVIYNPINIPKKAIGMGLRTEKKNLIVSVGRLVSQKRHDLLIQAFAKFHNQYPDYRLVIYGAGGNYDRLQAMVKDLNLEDRVSLPGKTSNVPEAIAGAKMFVLSSAFEGMSNALLEAMAIGIPCISTRVSGSTDLIEDHVNGLLVDVYDVDGIAEAMEYIASHPEEANIFAEKAHHVMDDLNISKISKIWVDYLRQLS